MRFSRHAKNQARRLGITIADAERVIATPVRRDTDPDGRPRFVGYIRGLRLRVVVALDEPGLIVTIHERRK